MMGKTMVQTRCMVLTAALFACGGSQGSGAAKNVQTAADALPKPPAEAVTVIVTSSKATNGGRPFRVVARAVDYNTYLTDTYIGVSNLVMDPDETVQTVDVIYPGHETILTVTKPDKDSIGLYFLFTDPDAAWKTYLEAPVNSTVALDEHSTSTPVALPESA
jgi:hypothetical protein